MPGGDRKGPEGEGARTGRGLGYCSGSGQPGFAAVAGRRGGDADGRGRFGRGGGRGRGRGGMHRGRGGMHRGRSASDMVPWQRALGMVSDSPQPAEPAEELDVMTEQRGELAVLGELLERLAHSVESLQDQLRKQGDSGE